MNQELQKELLEMMAEDERVRAELAATGKLFRGYAPRMAEVHHRNGQSLEKMVSQYGWPGKRLAGDKGARAAWYILQHAIGCPTLQRKCLPLLKEAVVRQEIEVENVAYLEDRICFYERRPQRFGTQFDWDDNGQMSPWKLQDPERVDVYRESVGLGPLSEQTIQMRRETAHVQILNHALRQAESEAWARSVGWL